MTERYALVSTEVWNEEEVRAGYLQFSTGIVNFILTSAIYSGKCRQAAGSRSFHLFTAKRIGVVSSLMPGFATTFSDTGR